MENSVKYFVVSLPRTGTTSICKMAKICGLTPKHAPVLGFENLLSRNDFNFFSDTPIFTLVAIERILLDEKINPKFIYIERDFNDVFDSWKRVNLYNNYLKLVKLNDTKYEMNPHMKFDLESYSDAFGGKFLDENNYNIIFENHKKRTFDIIENSKKPFLIYDFKDGWKPFCDFLNVDVPNEDLPILNKNKMFDKL